jgi:hypothetical protein
VSRPSNPAPCTLILGLLRSPGVDRPAVESALAGVFGPLTGATEEETFTHSGYYQQEMGSGLQRSFCAFEGLRDPGELTDLKVAANALEEGWAAAGRRAVNLDPGLVNLTQVVLATGKPAAHRIYVRQGIFAEVELVFERGSFRPLPWTYPDYRESRAIAFFNRVRGEHRRRLRAPAVPPGAGDGR